MKKISLLPVFAVVLFFLVFSRIDRVNGSERNALAFGVWREITGDSLLREAREVERALGVVASYGYDDFLSLETATYEIEKSDLHGQPYLGIVYIENGLAVGFSTHYRSTSRGMLTRFELAHFGELLHNTELSAIAGTGRDCARFAVLTIGNSENVSYLLHADVYRKMAKLGALPSLPPSHGRKGYAA